MGEPGNVNDRVAWLLRSVARLAERAGAVRCDIRDEEKRLRLDVDFADSRRAALWFDYDKIDSIATINVGTDATLSDEKVSGESFAWILGLVNAVAAGNCIETRYELRGYRLGTVVNITVLGRDWRNAQGLVWRSFPFVTATRVSYEPWVAGAPPFEEPANMGV